MIRIDFRYRFKKWTPLTYVKHDNLMKAAQSACKYSRHWSLPFKDVSLVDRNGVRITLEELRRVKDED